MSDVPKCSSWLGHKFEARYTLVSPPGTLDTVTKVNRVRGVDVSLTVKFDKHYERDVCVRCGWAIEKHIETTATPEAS